MNAINRFASSHLFVAFCASALTVETYLIAGIEINYSIPVIVFLATWFVYNCSGLRLVLHHPENSSSKIKVTLTGNRFRIIACLFSLPVIIVLLAGGNHLQSLIFIFTAACSLFYMMPFSVDGKELKGLRNRLYSKNIALSLIWAVATVVFPLAGNPSTFFFDTIIFIFLRHFFFIYALTIVFDLRDFTSDQKIGFKTIATELGEQKTRLFAWVCLVVFVCLTLFDQNLSGPITFALLFSAVFAAMSIAFSGIKKPVTYFTFLIDGSMALQCALVFFARLLW